VKNIEKGVMDDVTRKSGSQNMVVIEQVEAGLDWERGSHDG
jgi:hypothetical protein